MNRKVRARLKEPSTWAGIAMLGTVTGLWQAEAAMGLIQAIGLIIGAVGGAAAVAIPEKQASGNA